VFLLGINHIYDPDVWGHLSHGRLIWELKGLPENEVFTYPSTAMPYVYNAWLFGLLSYMVYLALNVYGLVLLKAASATIAFLILLKDSLKPNKNYTLAILVLTVSVVLTQFRFILRPDILLIVFLSYSIFSLNAYLFEGRKYIYSLPFMHILWANFGSSINVIFVPFAAFIVGGLVQRQFAKRGIGSKDTLSISQIKTIAAILCGSFAGTLINPHFIGQYFLSYDILSLEWARQEIVELQPPSGEALVLLISVVSVIALSFVLNRKRFSIIHVFMAIPIIIPAFMVKRLILLVIVVGTPMIIRNISGFLEDKGLDSFFRKESVSAFTASWIVMYCFLSLINVGPFGEKHMKFGFGFDYSMVPKGAVDYMESKNIQGKMMNTFHFGHYLIWTGHPKRQVFIDGRHILSNNLLDKSNTFRYIKSVLDELHETYGFESVLMTYPKNLGNIELALKPPEWALVYWDDISLLYLKRGGSYDAIIDEDEYKLVLPYLPTDSFIRGIGDRENQRNIEIELKRNLDETSSSLAITLLGLLYRSTGRHHEAIDLLSDSPASYTDHVILGDSYQKLGDIDKSLQYYKKALKLEANAGLMYMIAVAYMEKGETKHALQYLTQAVNKKSDIVYAYPMLIDIYQKLGRAEEAKKAREDYQIQMALKSASRYFENGEKAYQEKRYADAIKEFNKALRITPSDPFILTDMGYVYYDMGQLQMAHGYFIKVLDLTPSPSDADHGLKLPNAHYGLGLVYNKMGDREKAIGHFKKYVKTEPSGYYTRSAKRQLRELSKR
jgi:tetratricopeptide (TPR) repeat protein